MKRIANQWKDYECCDAGDGEKLERWQNISKAWLVVGDPEDDMPPSQAEILNTQLNSIQNEAQLKS